VFSLIIPGVRLDRRIFTRVQIEGTKVQYKLASMRKFISILSKPVEVKDISKSGLSFYALETLNSGEQIYMKVKFPDGRHLNLRGRIRWQEIEDQQDAVRIGVQFAPFGSSNEYNSMKDWEYLRSIQGLEIMERATE